MLTSLLQLHYLYRVGFLEVPVRKYTLVAKTTLHLQRDVWAQVFSSLHPKLLHNF